MSTIRQGSPGFRRPGSCSFIVGASGLPHGLTYAGTVLDINGQPLPFAQCELTIEANGSGPITNVIENLGASLTRETNINFSQIAFQADASGAFNIAVEFTGASPTARHFVRPYGGEGDAGALSTEVIP